MAKRFNVRVYGILIINGAVLVSDEFIKNNRITKFPGGGLEYGEGTRDCLIREFSEELGIEVSIAEHYYTTDFYVASSFDPNSQVISIYYKVTPPQEFAVQVSELPHDYVKKEGAQAFRWIRLNELRENDFTLIIDRKVAEMLLREVPENAAES
jgi:8-oxo-dGTP diphosphatase